MIGNDGLKLIAMCVPVHASLCRTQCLPGSVYSRYRAGFCASQQQARMRLLCRSFCLLLLAATLLVSPIRADGTQSEQHHSPEVEAPADNSNRYDDQIEEAPHVDEFPGSVDDLDVWGPCAGDIAAFCKLVTPGGSHLAECIQKQIMDEKQVATEVTSQITEKCKNDLLNYKMKLASNITLDAERWKACKDDVHRLCNKFIYSDDPLPGEVIQCLTDARASLSKVCAESIHEARLEATQDYRLDALLYLECSDEANRVCGHVEHGNGRVNACLRDNIDQV
jgi:hypothetical protein